jgi:hypothetical protein
VARFAIAASSQQMQVPNQATAQRIQTLISELEPSAVPHLSIAENSSNEQAMSTSDIAVTLEYDHEAYYAPNVCAKIHIVNTDVAAQIEESSVRIVSLHDALKIVGKGRAPYVEVTLDTNKSPEVDSHETIAIMNTLRHLGFTCTGWTPSPYAGIERPVLVFGGLTSAANEPVQPEYPVRYYEFGKAGTRRVALEIFSELYQKQVVLQ